MIGSSTLFQLFRGGFPEVEIQGQIVVYDGEKILFQTGKEIGKFPARSVLKPFQFLATEIVSAEIEKVRVRGSEWELKWTAALGSVSASREQVEQIKKWYSEEELSFFFRNIVFSPCFPMDEVHRVELKKDGGVPSMLYHTCFSKHAMILSSCRKNQWSEKNYQDIKHPYQEKLFSSLAERLGKEASKIEWVSDGCQLPSPVLSLFEMAKLYQSLAKSSLEREGANVVLFLIQRAMLSNPEWIGGKGRADTMLMQENPGKLIAKEGADGLLAMALLPTQEYPQGLGIVVKLNLGSSPHIAVLAIEPLLRKLGLKTKSSISKGHTIEYGYDVEEKKSNEA